MFNKDKLKNLMLKKGWTKYRLAKEANLGQSTVHEIISGKKKTPTSTTLSKLANALNVSVNDFFDNENSKENDNFDISEVLIELSKKVAITPELKDLIISLSKLEPNDLNLVENIIKSLSSK